MQPIGYTSHDVRVGCHVYWFKSLAEFKENARAVFEQFGNGINPPVPIILPISQEERVFEGLKTFLTANPGKSLEEHLDEWVKSWDKFYQEQQQANTSALNDFLGDIVDGRDLAQTGQPLPKDANQWLQFGFNRYKPDPVATTTSTTSTPPPIQTDEMRALADKIAGVVGERSIRLKDLAAELGATPEDIRPLIEADPRFAPIPSAQWVKLKPKD